MRRTYWRQLAMSVSAIDSISEKVSEENQLFSITVASFIQIIAKQFKTTQFLNSASQFNFTNRILPHLSCAPSTTEHPPPFFLAASRRVSRMQSEGACSAPVSPHGGLRVDTHTGPMLSILSISASSFSQPATARAGPSVLAARVVDSAFAYGLDNGNQYPIRSCRVSPIESADQTANLTSWLHPWFPVRESACQHKPTHSYHPLRSRKPSHSSHIRSHCGRCRSSGDQRHLALPPSVRRSPPWHLGTYHY